jgi:hypothetical protein
MRARRAEVVKDVGVGAARFFQRVGKHGEASGVKFA